MHQPKRNHEPALDRTWKGCEPICAVPPAVGTVSVLRVKVVGTPAPAEPAGFGQTRRYGNILPSHEDCIVQESAADDDNEYWDVDLDEVKERTLALARTLPAISIAELGIKQSAVRELPSLYAQDLEVEESGVRTLTRLHAHAREIEASGVRELRRLQLRMELEQRAPAPRAYVPTQRVERSWWQHSAFVAFCVLSALAVSLLATS
jgi:hypothetical protein